MLHISFWQRLAILGSCMVLTAILLPLTMSPHAVFAQPTTGSSTVTLNTYQGPPGTHVTATGSNWTAGDHMQISWADNGTVLANTTVGSTGTFTVSFVIPSNTIQGGHTIYFADLDSRYFLTPTFNVYFLTVQQVLTWDGNSNATTSFVSAGAIRYGVYVKNWGNTTLTATFTFLATGPQQIFSWSGPGPVAPGTPGFYSPSTIPANAPAGRYSLTVTVTYNSLSSSGQSQFTIKWRDRVGSNPYSDSTQCTWFAEGKMHDAIGLWMPNFGDAHSWRDNAPSHGWTVGNSPEVGSVLVMQYANGYQYSYLDPTTNVWKKTSISTVGHVGWVDSIGCNGSCVHLVDKNWDTHGSLGQRWISISGAPVNFIYSLR